MTGPNAKFGDPPRGPVRGVGAQVGNVGKHYEEQCRCWWFL